MIRARTCSLHKVINHVKDKKSNCSMSTKFLAQFHGKGTILASSRCLRILFFFFFFQGSIFLFFLCFVICEEMMGFVKGSHQQCAMDVQFATCMIVKDLRRSKGGFISCELTKQILD